MVRVAFIDESTDLLEEIDKEHYDAVLSILRAYASMRRRDK